jgi:hypothetical protein
MPFTKVKYGAEKGDGSQRSESTRPCSIFPRSYNEAGFFRKSSLIRHYWTQLIRLASLTFLLKIFTERLRALQHHTRFCLNKD